MLKAFKGEMGRVDFGVLRDSMLTMIKLVALAGGIFVLCRAQIAQGLAPMGIALLAAFLCRTDEIRPCGLKLGALLAGCLAGGMAAPPIRYNLTLPVGVAIVMSASLVWDFFVQRRPIAESSTLIFCGLTAGFGILVPGLIRGRGDLLPSLQTLGAAICASAAAPFIHSTLNVRTSRKFLMPEERIGLMLMAMGFTAGLATIYLPCATAAASLALLALYPSGALAGAALGGAILLVKGDSGLFVMLCAGGLSAQLLSCAQRYARAATMCLIMLATMLYLESSPGAIVGACLAAAAGMLMPEKWLLPFENWARQHQETCDPDRLARQLRRQTVERLSALSAAFEELAEGYLTPCHAPDEQTLIADMRARLCGGCPGYENCWTGSSNLGARFLCALIAQAVNWASGDLSEPLFEPEMPPDALRRCRRGRMIPERLTGILEDFARIRRAELKRGAENCLTSAQFLQAKQLLEGLAETQAKPVRLRDRQSARAAAVLERAGIPVETVMVLSSPRTEIIATLTDGRWNRKMTEIAKARLNRAFGRVYLPEEICGKETRFVRRPKFRAATGVGCVSRQAGVPSGDSHLIRMLDDERMLLIICDGMGSGEAAARESAAAVRLLTKFLSAGVECPLAIETVNTLLLNRGGEDMFATVDMLILDLSTGMGEFVKLAACPTLIARSGKIMRVEGGRLPLGILERVQPAISRVQLMPGDIVFMASDGVMDATDSEKLMETIVSCADGMSELVHRILSLTAGESARWRRDDMTALALKVS